MNKKICLISAYICTLGISPSLIAQQQIMPTNIIAEKYDQTLINNRVLAKVNQKSITVLDVLKKIDRFVYQRFPKDQQSRSVRFQLYAEEWEHFLEQIIEEELLISEAAERKLKVGHGKIRQEMEEEFGPNIRENLASINFSYEEMWEIISRELTGEELLGNYRWKSDREASPELIYKNYIENKSLYQTPGKITYQVYTFRNEDEAFAKNQAALFYEEWKKDKTIDPVKWGATVSKEISQKPEEMDSEIYKAVSSIGVEELSQPIAQYSRAIKQQTYKIFYLKEKKDSSSIPFSEVEQQIKAKIVQQIFQKEKDKFIESLRKRYGVERFSPPAKLIYGS